MLLISICAVVDRRRFGIGYPPLASRVCGAAGGGRANRTQDLPHEAPRLAAGPFGTAANQSVFRFSVHEAAGGERTGWARWGRKWLLDSGALELKWDE